MFMRRYMYIYSYIYTGRWYWRVHRSHRYRKFKIFILHIRRFRNLLKKLFEILTKQLFVNLHQRRATKELDGVIMPENVIYFWHLLKKLSISGFRTTHHRINTSPPYRTEPLSGQMHQGIKLICSINKIEKNACAVQMRWVWR